MAILGRRTHAIYAGPGCGKTTSLIAKLISLSKSDDFDISRVLFTSFTNVACSGIVDRVSSAGVTGDFEWFRTIHATALRSVGQTGKPMRWSHSLQFNKETGHKLTALRKDLFSLDDLYEGKLEYCQVYDLRRQRCEAVTRDGDSQEYLGFVDDYERFKQTNNLIDFTDMLMRFVEADRPLPLDYAFVDEAQDLNKLQLAVLEVACRECKDVFVALDDDQCIFTFGGSDAEWCLALKDKADTCQVNSKSHRLPRRIHAVAQKIAQRIPGRVEKNYSHNGTDGFVARYDGNDWDELAWDCLHRGTVMLVCRHTSRADTFAHRLNRLSVPNYVAGARYGLNDPVLTEIVTCLDALVDDEKSLACSFLASVLSSYSSIRLEDTKERLYRWGTKAELAEREGDITLDTFVEEYDAALFAKLLEDKDFKNLFPRLYLTVSGDKRSRCYQSLRIIWNRVLDGTNLDKYVRVSTIHGAKGMEADYVLWDNYYMGKSEHGLVWNRAEEHRIAYVAATRAKVGLYVLDGCDGRFYRIQYPVPFI